MCLPLHLFLYGSPLRRLPSLLTLLGSSYGPYLRSDVSCGTPVPRGSSSYGTVLSSYLPPFLTPLRYPLRYGVRLRVLPLEERYGNPYYRRSFLGYGILLLSYGLLPRPSPLRSFLPPSSRILGASSFNHPYFRHVISSCQ